MLGIVRVLYHVGKGDLAWLTNNSDSDLIYESDALSSFSDSDADNSVPGSKAGSKGRPAGRNEDEYYDPRQNRQQGPSEGLPVPSTISRKDTSAADSIDLQILAEKSNELALAGQDNEREHGRRSPKHRLEFRRSSSTGPMTIAPTLYPSYPPPPPPPDIRSSRPHTGSIHPQNPRMVEILPSSTL
jgi:hypothetical protein